MTSAEYLDAGGFLAINISWGLGLIVALYVSIGVSGGHLNPAVTLAMALRGRLPWVKVQLHSLCNLHACAWGLIMNRCANYKLLCYSF